MDILILILSLLVVSALAYWVLNSAYLAIVHQAHNLASPLSLKMTLATLLGFPLAGFGGIVISAWIFNNALKEHQTYHQIRDLLAGLAMSLIVTALLLLFAFFFILQLVH